MPQLSGLEPTHVICDDGSFVYHKDTGNFKKKQFH